MTEAHGALGDILMLAARAAGTKCVHLACCEEFIIIIRYVDAILGHSGDSRIEV